MRPLNRHARESGHPARRSLHNKNSTALEYWSLPSRGRRLVTIVGG